MKIIKKTTLVVILLLIGVLPVFAQDVELDSAQDVSNILFRIFDFFYTIFFIIAAGLFLYGAYLFLFAGDDPDKVGTAKKVLLYSVVAVVVALLALGIDDIVASIIGVGG